MSYHAPPLAAVLPRIGKGLKVYVSRALPLVYTTLFIIHLVSFLSRYLRVGRAMPALTISPCYSNIKPRLVGEKCSSRPEGRPAWVRRIGGRVLWRPFVGRSLHGPGADTLEGLL